MMKPQYLKFILIVLLLCIPAVCSAVTIIEPSCGHAYCGFSGYSWTTPSKDPSYMLLTISSSGEYAFANADFPRFRVKVEAAGVTLDGEGVTMQQIDGRKDLNLKNIDITYTGSDAFSAITECNDIVHSSIFVAIRDSQNWDSVSAIGELRGTIDDSTKITIRSQRDAYGIHSLSGTIAGGRFDVTSHQRSAYGVGTISSTYGGTIAGGTFTITGQEKAYGVRTVYGSSRRDGRADISGGTFEITGQKEADGVSELYGEVSGGEFTVTSQQSSVSGVGILRGKVSGGTFTVTAQENAYGIWQMNGVGTEISNGRFTVTSQQGNANGVGIVTGKVSGGTFAVTSQQGDASGVNRVKADSRGRDANGRVTGGEFVITSNQNLAYGVLSLAGGEVSGGRFTVAGKAGAYKVGEISENGQVSGGTFTIEEVTGIPVPSLNPTVNPTNTPKTTVGEADINIDPIGVQTAGSTFEITGTTYLDYGEELLVKIAPSTGTSGVEGIVPITRGSYGLNQWSFTVDTASLRPDEYTVGVSGVNARVRAAYATFTL